MAEPSVIHDTFVIEHAFPVAPARVFAALADPALKRRWYADGGAHEVVAFEMDFRVGGAERAVYRFKADSPFPGASLENVGTHLEIAPDKRVVIASTMALDGRRFSASLVTFDLLATADGTDLVFTHQGAFFEGADGSERRRDGWIKLLDQLAKTLA